MRGRDSLRVVLTDSGPLPLSNIGSVLLPVLGAVIVLLEPALLDAEDVVLVNDNHGEGLATFEVFSLGVEMVREGTSCRSDGIRGPEMGQCVLQMRRQRAVGEGQADW